MPNSLNCTYSSSGDAFSLKNSLIPFLCDIEQDLSVMNVDELKNHYSIGEVLQVKRGPTADAGFLTTISVGVIFFVAGWAGNKFLDELYEARLRPRIKPWLNKLDVGLAKNSKKVPNSFKSVFGTKIVKCLCSLLSKKIAIKK